MRKLILLLFLAAPLLADTKTNLKAVIKTTISTNTTFYTNEKGCSTCDGITKHYWALYHERSGNCFIPYQPPTEKTEIITIISNRTVYVDFENKILEYRQEFPLASKTNIYKLETSWVKLQELAPILKNTNFVPNSLGLTNYTPHPDNISR